MSITHYIFNLDNGDIFKLGKFYIEPDTSELGFTHLPYTQGDYQTKTMRALSFYLAAATGCRLTIISSRELPVLMEQAFDLWKRENHTECDGVSMWSVQSRNIEEARTYQKRRFENFRVSDQTNMLNSEELPKTSKQELREEIIAVLVKGIRVTHDEIGKLVPQYEYGDQITRHSFVPYWIQEHYDPEVEPS